MGYYKLEYFVMHLNMHVNNNNNNNNETSHT